jgi:hypothetical protein
MLHKKISSRMAHNILTRCTTSKKCTTSKNPIGTCLICFIEGLSDKDMMRMDYGHASCVACRRQLVMDIMLQNGFDHAAPLETTCPMPK